jgi:hypothetical protein
MKTIKLSVILLLSLVCLSCNNEDINDGSNEISDVGNSTKMASFEDWDSFINTYLLLSSHQEDDLIAWIEKNGHSALYSETSLLNEENSDDMELLTPGLLAVLNSEYEFMVGNEIILFNAGKFYSSGNEQDEWTVSLSEKLNSWEVVGEVTSQIITDVEDEEKMDDNGNFGVQKLTVGTSGGTGGILTKDIVRGSHTQCNGTVYPGPEDMRYLQQLKSFQMDFEIGSTAQLYIETKLYYKSGSSWKPAGKENRNYTYSLSGTATLVNGYNVSATFPIQVNTSRSCITNQFNSFLLVQANYAKGGSPQFWDMNVTGTITHHINGDYTSNKWYAPVNWN